MLRDPIELFRYPEEWGKRRDAREMVESGLYILTEDGFLRRGITTATTVSAAVVGAISSLYSRVKEVTVKTPACIPVKVKVEAENGAAKARKFAGDHEFDATNGIIFKAEVTEKPGSWFERGIGVKNGVKAVSKSAMAQIVENYKRACKKFGFDGGVRVTCPEGEKVAEKTGNKRLGIRGGISILGTTGFVEPWCEKLVKTKLQIAMQYEKIAITTGRKAWLYARENFPDYQPFVFGVHIDEALKHPGEKIIVGFPGILRIWAKGDVYRKATEVGAKVVVIEDDLDSWVWNLQGACD